MANDNDRDDGDGQGEREAAALIERGADLAGALAGGALGLVGGPLGAFGGAVLASPSRMRRPRSLADSSPASAFVPEPRLP